MKVYTKIIISSLVMVIVSVLGACASAPQYTNKTSKSYTTNLEAFQPKHYSNAYNYFYSRAIHGNPAAQNNLGHMYMDGRGVSSDPSKAIYWYTQSANQGYRAAQVNLGVAYLYGRGTKKDKTKACYWLARAQRQGSREASEFYRRKCP